MICCSRVGCKNDGKWYPKLCVPILNEPRDTHQPIETLLNVVFCDEHKYEFWFDGNAMMQLENERLRSIFICQASHSGLMIDFARTYVLMMPVTNEEWQQFQRCRGHQQ